MAYQESQEFSGFRRERIAGLYPKLAAKLNPEQVVEILNAERNGTIEARKRDAMVELRTRKEFPEPWEVETKRLNKTKFVGMVALVQGGLVVLVQGDIGVLAWIFRGFKKKE